MILLVLMSFILIAGYVFAMIKKMEEIPYSISDTYYALTHKFWFGLCMIGVHCFFRQHLKQVRKTASFLYSFRLSG